MLLSLFIIMHNCIESISKCVFNKNYNSMLSVKIGKIYLQRIRAILLSNFSHLISSLRKINKIKMLSSDSRHLLEII